MYNWRRIHAIAASINSNVLDNDKDALPRWSDVAEWTAAQTWLDLSVEQPNPLELGGIIVTLTEFLGLIPSWAVFRKSDYTHS